VDQYARARAGLEAVQQLRRWVVFGLLGTIAAALVALMATVLELVALDDSGYPPRTPLTLVADPGFADMHRLASRASGVLLACVALTALVFLAWLWKAREVAADLRGRMTEGDAWVTLGWLPLVNFVVPYSIVSGLYGDADPDVRPGDAVAHRSGRAWWLLGLWWMPSLVVLLAFNLRLFAVLGRPVRLVAPQLNRADVGTITSTLLVDVIVLAAMAMSACGAVLVVRRITRRLEQCVARFGVASAPPTQSLVTAAASHAPE
jgi:hypothetical protein